MKRKLYYLSLAGLAALFTALTLTGELEGAAGAAALPFSLLGRGLRALSLSGGAGNAAAVALYAVFCLSPCIIAALRLRKARRREDVILVLLSALLFFVMYRFINPRPLYGGSEAVTAAIYGGTVWSTLCVWAAFAVVRSFKGGSARQLYRYMGAALWALAAVFIFEVFAGCTGGLRDSIKALREGNTGAGSLTLDCVSLTVKYIVAALPSVFDILIAERGLALTSALGAEDGEAASRAAGGIAALAARALIVTLTAVAGYNIAELLLAPELRSVNATLSVPVFSLAFTLAAFLAARLIDENRRLREDSDSII